jgi:exonuclease VII large subunit
MEEFDINKSYFINPLSDVMIEHQKEMDRIEEAMEKSMQEKIEREKKSIELQETIVEQNERLIKLQKIEVNFMRNMSEDTSKLANLLKNLEKTNAINGEIIEANMLEKLKEY